MSKVIIHYDNIYLVGMNEERSSSHRVTGREHGRPGTVSFTGHFPLENGEETYGVLVINEELWAKWFGSKDRLPHMDTAALAAAYLVKNQPNIFYGCPFCTFRTKEYEDARLHIEQHASKYFSQFRIEVEE